MGNQSRTELTLEDNLESFNDMKLSLNNSSVSLKGINKRISCVKLK